MVKKKNKKIVVLDAHAIIHRAYHALPDFSSSNGEPTGALYGISTMLFAIIKEFKPDYIVAAFDLPKPTYRHEAYADYKSGRKGIDDNLVKQLQRSRDVFKAFNIPIYEKEGFEADDVIGTVAKQLAKKDVDVIIASGDMDTMQLVDKKKVQVYTLRKGIKDTVLYDEKAVKERFGFKPEMLIDYKGLRGDASDNIIGIPGIGEKTATDLITKVGTIEDIYKNIDKLEDKGFKPRIVNLLKEHKEEAEFSKMLATIRRDVPIKTDLKELDWNKNVSVKKIKALFDELEFRSLNNRLQEIFNGLGHEVIAPASLEATQDETEVSEVAIALSVLNSAVTNPNVQDVFSFAKTDDFQKAKEHIFSELKKQGTFEVFETIEKPLIRVVKEMGENGIKIDTKVLADLSKDYHQKLSKIEKEIYKLSGEEFNINSPKQLAEVLFTKMELTYKGMRKTSSGAYSTKEEVLQKLLEVHPIAEKLLEYRELQKLLSTYIDNFPKYVGKDGRIHPRFIQTGAATGRMASEDPAVQNIPIRSELGRKIRDAFVAPRGKKLLAFDYSQIELRIAAILSEDEKMMDAFKEGRDIHTNAAMHVFDVKEEEITKEMRIKAKTINFGILFGMGVNALQKNLKTDRKEAQEFYNKYFEAFPTLADYLNRTKEFAQKNGYTETMFGRRRYFEGIKSKLPFIRAAAERMAINAPIQGTEADVIKLAMINVDNYLEKKKLKDKVKVIMQVHDEIVYECDKDLIDEVAGDIKKIMEEAFGDKDTKGVPILVEGSSGTNWGNMMRLML